MSKIRYVLTLVVMLLCPMTSTSAQVNIRVNLSVFPELVAVSGYPVYYAPHLDANFFFYDGLYWVYQDDEWYTSSWYNGPWWLVYPEDVPVFILRIPVRYYRQPPVYFYGWRRDASPRWGDYWGYDWRQPRRGWDKWDHRFVPPRAPRPDYQRQYSGDRYPRQVDQQHELHQRNYRYQPKDPVVRQQYQEQAAPMSPVQREMQRAPEDRRATDNRRTPEGRGVWQQDNQRSQPPQKELNNIDRNVDRSVITPEKQERIESQYRRQQSEQAPENREQHRIRSEPKEQQRGGNNRNEREWREQEQRREQVR